MANKCTKKRDARAKLFCLLNLLLSLTFSLSSPSSDLLKRPYFTPNRRRRRHSWLLGYLFFLGQLFKSWLAVNNEFKLTSNLVLIWITNDLTFFINDTNTWSSIEGYFGLNVENSRVQIITKIFPRFRCILSTNSFESAPYYGSSAFQRAPEKSTASSLDWSNFPCYRQYNGHLRKHFCLLRRV